MKYLKNVVTGTIMAAVALSAGSITAYADDKTAERPSFVHGSVEPQEFVDKASSAGIVEVELAKLALAKSTMAEVRHFAQIMIEDHTAANAELRKLATAKGLSMPDEPTLMKRSKAYVLEMQAMKSFDEDYAKNQLKAHTDTLELFRRAANSSDNDVKKFADAMVPTLEHHFSMSQTLVDSVAKSTATPQTGTAAEEDDKN